MKKYFLAFSMLLTLSAVAGPGDSTVIRAMDHMDMTWNQAYYDTAALPSGTTTYNRILMLYTMGCASGGCSDWDYTTSIRVDQKTGQFDSTVSSIDTISTNPLIIDTSYFVYEITKKIELGRVITPYGSYMRNGSNGYTPNWEHTYVFDVTPYAQLLKDTVAIAAVYSGYSSGFSATVDFIFIEGTPDRDVLAFDQIYKGSKAYYNSTQFENWLTPAKLPINPSASQAELRFTPTGHGFVNALNCAEFCNKKYFVKVDGTQIDQQEMWRDDCGMNPIFPQGGTWLYDRGNWCPGDEGIIYTHNLGNIVGKDSIEVNVDIEAYTYTVPSGETPATYIVEGHVLQFGDFNFQVDASIEEIVAPNNNPEYRRSNPNCHQAMVKIMNHGAQPLTSAKIYYGVKNGVVQSFNWTGNLSYGETEIVSMPMDGAAVWASGDAGTFQAEIVVSNDEVSFNNTKTSAYSTPPVVPVNCYITTKTNSVGSDTHWKLYDNTGNVIMSRDNMASNTSYFDTLNLPDACYELVVEDRSKNGLSWWANNDGAGYVRFRNIGGSLFVYNLPADFGTEYHYFFTTGSSLGTNPLQQELSVEVYPNPSKGALTIEWPGNGLGTVDFTVYTVEGQLVYSASSQRENDLRQTLDLSHLKNGLYLLHISENGRMVTKKIEIAK